jgi:hypothetical protein
MIPIFVCGIKAADLSFVAASKGASINRTSDLLSYNILSIFIPNVCGETFYFVVVFPQKSITCDMMHVNISS